MEDVMASVVAILADQLDISASEIKPTSTLESLSVDSLVTVEIFFAIEEKFEIELTDDELDRLAAGTVQKLVDYITKKVSKK